MIEVEVGLRSLSLKKARRTARRAGEQPAMARISDDYPGPGQYDTPRSRSMTVLTSPRKSSARSSSPRRQSPRSSDGSELCWHPKYADDDGNSTQGAFASGSYSARGGSQFASDMTRESRACGVKGLISRHTGDPGAHSAINVNGVLA